MTNVASEHYLQTAGRRRGSAHGPQAGIRHQCENNVSPRGKAFAPNTTTFTSCVGAAANDLAWPNSGWPIKAPKRPRIEGGFKTLRQQNLEILNHQKKIFWLLSGRTSSAKTVIIKQLPNSIDLEGHANHRGSAFGRRLTPQPSPVSFECALTVDYLKHSKQNLVVEDEGRTIGSNVPNTGAGINQCNKPISHCLRSISSNALATSKRSMLIKHCTRPNNF